MQVDLIQSLEDLNRTKRWRKSECALCATWDIRLLLSLDIGALASWTFRVRLNHTTRLPGSPAYRWQIVGLYGLSNCPS